MATIMSKRYKTPLGRQIEKRKDIEGAQLLTKVNGTVAIVRENRERSERESRDRSERK